MKRKRFAPKRATTSKPPETVVRGETKPPDTQPGSQTIKAWRVKVVYMQERGRWETLKSGKTIVWTPPKSYDGKPAVTIDGEYELEAVKASVWQRIVDWCASRSIHPEEYVRYCFSLIPTLDRTLAPEPAQLLTDKYENLWLSGERRRAQAIEVALTTQKEKATQRIVVYQAVNQETMELATLRVISEANPLELSPLFCYCLARSVNTKALRRTARRLKGMAVLQFETNRRLYRKLWRDVLPNTFPDESRELYPYLLSRLWESRKTTHSHDDL